MRVVKWPHLIHHVEMVRRNGPLPERSAAALDASVFWPLWLLATFRLPTLLATVAGFLAAQLSLVVVPETPLMAARVGLRVALSVWMVLALGGVVRALVRGEAGWPAHQPGASCALYVALAGGVLVAAALQRAPSRLVLNLLGYALTAMPLLWVVRRGAGTDGAARAALALAVFAFFTTHLNLHQGTGYEYVQAQADSRFRWTVGWPVEGWVLRHEVLLEPPGGAEPVQVAVRLAGAYTGPAQVFASVNGHQLGPMQGAEHGFLTIEVPAPLLINQQRLMIELRAQPPDPALRVLAQRWAAGATLGPEASSFFDTRDWRPGTFNDENGRQQPGVLLVQLVR